MTIRMKRPFLGAGILGILCSFVALGQDPPAPPPAPVASPESLRSIRRVYIEKMPNDLDQYLRAEIAKQFKGYLVVVLDKNDADGILTGIDEERKGTGAQIT